MMQKELLPQHSLNRTDESQPSWIGCIYPGGTIWKQIHAHPQYMETYANLVREFTSIETSNEDSSKHVQVAYKKSQEIELKNGMK